MAPTIRKHFLPQTRCFCQNDLASINNTTRSPSSGPLGRLGADLSEGLAEDPEDWAECVFQDIVSRDFRPRSGLLWRESDATTASDQHHVSSMLSFSSLNRCFASRPTFFSLDWQVRLAQTDLEESWYLFTFCLLSKMKLPSHNSFPFRNNWARLIYANHSFQLTIGN